jgi:hypothetical protein
LLVASWLRVKAAYRQDAEDKSKGSYDGITAALNVLHGAVAGKLGFEASKSGKLRITLHRVVSPIENPEKIEQVVRYVGGKGEHPGRQFRIQSGIAGRAARNGTVVDSSRQSDDYEAFIRELIDQWGYTETDARALTSDRRAWMAVPIFNKQERVIGVVYLDSSDKDFFTADVMGLVQGCCAGLASYLHERYA